MTDMTRPPGDHTPTTPDARGESALGTGHGTTPGRDRGDLHGIDAHRGDPRATDADRAAAHGTAAHGTQAARGDAYGNGTGTDRATGASAAHRGEPGTSKAGTAGSHLLPHDESDKLGAQLQHAVAGFVDGPRAAVEEADHVLEEIAARFTEAVTRHRRSLRQSWQSVEGGEGKPVSSADTEQLRLALKAYRQLGERLLHV
ncbi:hypothetical protein [Streptomyces sp. NPDC002788]